MKGIRFFIIIKRISYYNFKVAIQLCQKKLTKASIRYIFRTMVNYFNKYPAVAKRQSGTRKKDSFMNKNLILLSAILLSTNCMMLQAKKDSSDTTTKVVKAKKIVALQSGDTLDLSEFTKTNSGIMFKITKKGSGDKPLLGETVVVHYTGYLLVDGKKVGLKFDSSLDRDMPFSFKLGGRQVIAGWEISLADMKIGEERIVILPSKQAYGSRATSKIPADSTLIFEISLIKAS